MDIRITDVASKQLNALPEAKRAMVVTGLTQALPSSIESTQPVKLPELGDAEVRLLKLPNLDTTVIYRLKGLGDDRRAIVLSILDKADLPKGLSREHIHLADDLGASAKIGQEIISHLD